MRLPEVEGEYGEREAAGERRIVPPSREAAAFLFTPGFGI